MDHLRYWTLAAVFAAAFLHAARAQEPPPAPVGAAPTAPAIATAPPPLPTSPPMQGPQFEYLSPAPEAEPAPKRWTNSIGLGLNAADGNSRFTNIAVATETNYESPLYLFKSTFNYNFATANSIQTQNQAYWYNRLERLITGTPWSLYGTGILQYDRLRDFDLQLSSFSGVGFAVIKTNRTLVKTRIGAGGAKDLGGLDDSFQWEMNAGADLEQKIGDRSKIVGRFDYYPEFANFGNYRLETQAWFETMICTDFNIALRLGVLDLYDNTPAAGKSNQLNYSAVLLWKY